MTPTRSLLALVILMGSFTLAGEGKVYSQTPTPSPSATPTKNAYPDEVVKTFMKGCQINGNKAFCTCFLDQLQFRYTFTEFTKLDAQIRETRKVPTEVQEIVTSCRQPKNF